MKNDMRVVVTRRMLREGLYRCMESTALSKITVSDLCRESGVNRATFYNHYDSPAMILKEISHKYAEELMTIYSANLTERNKIDDAALEACFRYILERKDKIKMLFSENAENYLAGICMELIDESVEKKLSKIKDSSDRYEEYMLCAATTAAATFGFIQIWLTTDIDKSPKELVNILKKVVRGNVFL